MKKTYRETEGKPKPLSELISSSMDSSAGNGESARKARRAHQVKNMYKTVIEQIFQNSPASARLFLEHTNAVYIIKEGEAKILIVYVDESIFAAELNGRREVIKMKFGLLGEDLSEFRILISRGEYKKNHPYASISENVSHETFRPAPITPAQLEEMEKEAAGIQDESIKSAFLKAMIEVKGKKTSPDTKNLNNRS